MSALAVRLTAEEFENLPEKEGYKLELMDGEVFEVSSGGPIHEQVKGNFAMMLAVFCHTSLPKALVTNETRYRLGADSMPQPDVSVVLSGRLDPERTGKIQAIPAIAVEVVSSETAIHLRKKIEIYLAVGVKSVWVAYPEIVVIDIYTNEGARRLESGDVLDDRTLPGFSLPVADLFQGI